MCILSALKIYTYVNKNNKSYVNIIPSRIVRNVVFYTTFTNFTRLFIHEAIYVRFSIEASRSIPIVLFRRYICLYVNVTSLSTCTYRRSSFTYSYE